MKSSMLMIQLACEEDYRETAMKNICILTIAFLFNISMLISLIFGIIAGVAGSLTKCFIYMTGAVICQIFFLFFLMILKINKRCDSIETILKGFSLPQKPTSLHKEK
jgi:hypothetical protein